MAKTKSGSKTTKFKLDMMSVAVLLVMSIFGGLIGYQLGLASGAATALSLRQPSPLMVQQGGK